MKVKDICNLQNGRAFKPDDWGSEGLPIVRIQNLNDESAPFNYFDGEYNSVHEINDGELLFSWSGTPGTSFGAFRWYRGKGLLNQHIFRVMPKINVDKDYLKFALNGNIGTIISKAHGGVGLQHITKKELDEVEIPIPSVEDQHVIVSTLQRIEALISLRRKELQALDDLIKARFVEMFGTIHDNKFGYEIRTIQDVCEPIKDGTHQTPEYTEDTENGFKFLSSKDVTSGKIDWDHLKYIPDHLHEALYARIAPRKGDLLLAKNGTTGIAAIVDRDEVFDIYVSLALLRPKSVDSTYLWGAVNAQETKEQFDASLKGIGVPNLHLGEIKKTKIIVPPMDKQLEFSAFVSQVDKSKFAVQKALDEAQTFFDSLMQKYFG